MRSVVYLIAEAGNFDAAIMQLQILKTTHGAEGFIVLPYDLPGQEDAFARAAAVGISVLHFDVTGREPHCVYERGKPQGLRSMPALNAKLSVLRVDTAALARLNNLLDRNPADSELARIAREIFACKMMLAQRARAVLDWTGASVLLMAEDQIGRDHPLWISAIHERKGRAYSLSHAAVTPEEFYHYARTYPPCYVTDQQAQLYADVLENCAIRHEAATSTRLPLPEILVWHALALIPPKPWVINSGFLDGIIVEGDAIADVYRTEGISAAQLVPLGHPSQDRMSRLKATSSSGPLRLLWGVPPDNFAHCPNRLFPDYAAFFETTLKTLAAIPDCEMLFTLHPNLAPEWRAQAERYGHVLGPAAQAIPKADLFLTTASSTMKLARAMGLPVIDYDVFGYHYAFLRNADGIERIETIDEFDARMKTLGAMNRAARQNYIKRAHDSRTQWGVLDGQAGFRIGAFLAESLPASTAAMASSIDQEGWLKGRPGRRG